MSGNAAGQSVGFVGLGNMGGRMTRRLVLGGIHVTGYDLRPGQAESVGATAAASLGDVCDGTSAVLLSLPDSRAVEAVVLGERPSSDGLLAFARPGQVLVVRAGKLFVRPIEHVVAPDGALLVRKGIDAKDDVVLLPWPEAHDGQVVTLAAADKSAAR